MYIYTVIVNKWNMSPRNGRQNQNKLLQIDEVVIY